MTRPAETADERLRDIGKITVVHANAVGVRTRVEHHLRIADKAFLDEHAPQLDAAEGRHRALLAVRVHVGNLALAGQAQPCRPRQLAQPVEIDQRACVYTPRVIGARVGQTLRVRNSDNWLHNVHTDSSRRNAINQSTPKAGMDVNLLLKDEEMLRVGCDVHRWMTAWVGVVSHPYFAVSEGKGGTYTIANVPAGHRTVTAWHEAFGALTKAVDVKDGQTSTVDFIYTQK